jgi:hypothetical protein
LLGSGEPPRARFLVQPEPHAPAPSPEKPSNRGCWIALAVAGCVGVLIVILGAVAITFLASSKEGKAVIATFNETSKMMEDAAKAPGTAELRAAGCDGAMALDLSRLDRIASGSAGDAGSFVIDAVTVTCVVSDARSAPACDHLAKVYVRAGGVTRSEFSLTVTMQDGRDVCASRYDASGTFIRAVSAARPPGGKSP